ncbi:MAG: glycoside hydrolase family 78 protein [Armatimonadetes bacterium]|nr:glycoside hydrolase family 78 protein [Armatimonadota bacterium]
MRRVIACVACGVLLALCQASAAIRVASTRTEYEARPLGIGPRVPRLSWSAAGDRRGERQSAYQVTAAASETALGAGRDLLWDSGKVASDQSQFVDYGGPALTSRQRVWWRVRVWDERDAASPWSESAWFETGLLKPADWQAKWVTTPRETADPTWQGAKWIWTPGDNEATGHRYFRTTVNLPADVGIQEAALSITVDDQFTAFLNGEQVGKSSGQGDAWRSPIKIDLRGKLKTGPNVLAIDGENGGSAAGLLARLALSFNGTKAPVVSGPAWKCSTVAAPEWNTVSFDDKGWTNAKVIADYGLGPWGQLGPAGTGGGLPPVTYLRRGFDLTKQVSRARLYVTALGLYRCRLNGQNVGDAILAPDWTDYRKRVEAQTYDVTSLVKPGANVLGALLGDGWYAGHVGLGGRQRYGQQAWFLAQLMIDHPDGTTTVVASGDNWKARSGPILFSDLLMGEGYDARAELGAWDKAGYDDATWQAAKADVPNTVSAVEWPMGPPVRRLTELPAKTLAEPKPGRWTFDLGQNMVGYARLKVNAAAGTKLTLRFAEMLNPDGTVYTTNYRGARCTDEYTCRGGGVETWEPTFTFRGYRYVELTGLTAKPALDAVTGVVIGSDAPESGTFECSDPLLNQLQRNIVWGQRGNFVSVPTDCPQRDERLGWTGDAQIFVRTATFNNQVGGFFTKWLVDLDDAQAANGAYPDVAPRVAAGDGTAAWGDAGVVCPWTVYQAYGDRRLLADHYPNMVRWVEYCREHSNKLLRPASGYGDWLSIGANTPTDVLATAYFARSTELTARAATVLGKTEDAAKYKALWDDIAKAFQAAYVQPDARIKGNTQTCYLLALRFGLLPEAQRAQAATYLATDIEQRGWRLSTGFVGVGHLLPTLTQVGRTDVAWKLLLQDAFPSWLFSVKHGATTIWERWDGWTPDKGFQDAGMNSFNHYSFGSCGEWMYANILGIAPDVEGEVGIGYRRIVVEPRPGGGVTSAKGSYRSGYGLITTDWRLDDGKLTLSVTVPVGVTARVVLPPSVAKESGKPLAKADGVKVVSTSADGSVCEVGSGTWRFTP